MKTDIVCRKDILFIITKFYQKLIDDHTMYPFFKEFIEQNTLDNHLEIITNFWEDILFNTNKYKNNTIQKHLKANTFIPFKKEHFSIWLAYFSETIDEFFEGIHSENMKNRAKSIATVMQLKMNSF